MIAKSCPAPYAANTNVITSTDLMMSINRVSRIMATVRQGPSTWRLN
jgi:hypothetical protein